MKMRIKSCKNLLLHILRDIKFLPIESVLKQVNNSPMNFSPQLSQYDKKTYYCLN